MKWYKEIEKDRDFVFNYTDYDRGISLAPSGASATFFNNQGTEIQASSPAVLSGDEMQFTLLTANNDTLGRNFKVEMVFTTNGTEKTVGLLFDVVRLPIDNVVIDEDLFDYIKELRDGREKISKITTATTSTFTDSSLDLDTRDWKGGRGTFLEDSGNTDFKITAYTKSTQTVTFTPTIAIAPAVGSRYIMRMSFQDQIDIAYKLTLMKIRSRVGIAGGYIDTNVFNTLVVYKTLESICLNAIEEAGDKWELRKDYYAECFMTELGAFYEAYDTNNDGNIDDEETLNKPTFSSITNVRGRQKETLK